ncbi:MAG: ABC transporter permease [Lachnospiraceae bacterium]|nr:ABC transporter permease [Lachnospiraceae bacterium]
MENRNFTDDQFVIVGCSNADSEKLVRPQTTYWKDAWRRLKQNHLAIAAMVVLLLIILLTIFGPAISGYSYEKMSADMNQTPSMKHWFGTDSLGRDLFARVWIGGRVSIIIGVVGAVITTIIGSIYGSISAFAGGRVDSVMMRIVEIISSIPYLIVVILLSLMLDDSGIGSILLALCLVGWCPTARLVRGQILQLASAEYVTAAKTLGVSNGKIIMRHMIPNTLSVIIVNLTFRIPGYIFSESFLSYVGLGIKTPNTSWGMLAASAQANIFFYPYQLLFPALMIGLTMLSFTLFGDGLRDALDPKLRR